MRQFKIVPCYWAGSLHRGWALYERKFFGWKFQASAHCKDDLNKIVSHLKKKTEYINVQ